MPTFKKIIEDFIDSHECPFNDKEYKDLLLGNNTNSFVLQEEIAEMIKANKNIIKTTNKEAYSNDIEESIKSSIEATKKFGKKVSCKNIYDEFVDCINERFDFKVNINDLNLKIPETPEERCVYILRETERKLEGKNKKSLADMAKELGCSTRNLQKDVKEMTEQGFKLLGMSIKLVDNRDEIFQLDSTPHPVILMQNVSQLFVQLEGLRAMENTEALKNIAHSTAIDIWNQLSDYARDKILDVAGKIEKDQKPVKWYLSLDEDGNWQSRFTSERYHIGESTKSKLMYHFKCGEEAIITYIGNDGKHNTVNDCRVKNYYFEEDKIVLEANGIETEIEEDCVLDVISTFHP